MAKGFDWEEIQSGNWNVAKPWTIDKIHKWSILIDDFQTLSIFGNSDIYGDVFNRDINLKNTARIYALKRLIHAITTLLRNTRFAIKGSEGRDFIPVGCEKGNKNQLVDFKNLFGYYKERLIKIENHVDRLRIERKRGKKVIELLIDEDLFNKMMNEITNIIDDVHYILNYNNLIFTHTEDYDPKKIKEAYKEKYVNKGG